MEQFTITELAKRLGVSPSTVSRALSDHPDISLETKKMVKELAEQLHFRPNAIAQSLKSRKSTTIGVMVPEIQHDFFAFAISGIEEIAHKYGYTIIVSQSNESYEREVINANVLLYHRVAGIIASIAQDTKNSDHFKNCIDNGIPLVFFDRVCSDLDADKIIIDDRKSAYNATNYLINRGYKKIAHFGGPQSLDICRQRFDGYKDALKDAGIKLEKKLIKFGSINEQGGYNSMHELLDDHVMPDAILCLSDPVATGAFQKIKEAGLKIPDDIALVGYSNNKISRLLDPALTTVNQPSFEMGKKAAEILLKLIENKSPNQQTETIVLDTELIVRDST